MKKAVGGRAAAPSGAHADEASGPATEKAATKARPTWHLEGYHCYSWLEDYLVRLDGKEVRQEYYMRCFRDERSTIEDCAKRSRYYSPAAHLPLHRQ